MGGVDAQVTVVVMDDQAISDVVLVTVEEVLLEQEIKMGMHNIIVEMDGNLPIDELQKRN